MRTSPKNQCTATTPRGTRCKIATVGNSLYCMMHDPSPEQVEIRRKNAASAGRAKAYIAFATEGHTVESSKDVFEYLKQYLTATMRGNIKLKASELATYTRLFMDVEHRVSQIDRLQKLEQKKLQKQLNKN